MLKLPFLSAITMNRVQVIALRAHLALDLCVRARC
jgi:hypothetical protein